MTGKEAFRKALQLLGLTDQNGEPDVTRGAESYKLGLAAVNQIVAELSLAESGVLAPPLTSLQQAVPLTEPTARTVLPYGVAMLVAAAENDGDKQSLFAALYDGRRAACCRAYTRRVDTLPRGCDA